LRFRLKVKRKIKGALTRGLGGGSGLPRISGLAVGSFADHADIDRFTVAKRLIRA
jgi:hypothetical protein